MDSDTIEATLIGAAGSPFETPRSTAGPIPKTEFAPWLLNAISEYAEHMTTNATHD
jgi:hypothetical protein